MFALYRMLIYMQDFFGIALQIFDDLWKIADPHLDDGDAQNAEDEAALFKNCMIGTRILLNELQSKVFTCPCPISFFTCK